MCDGKSCGNHSTTSANHGHRQWMLAYSANIYIPAKSELTATMQSIIRSQFFLDYNFNYTNVSNFIVWYKTNSINLTKGEIE